MSEFSDPDAPRDLPKLPGDRPRPRKQSNLGTWIGLFAVIVGGTLFVGLTALVMPSALGLVVVVFFAAIFFMLHYMTWGRWLMNRRRLMEQTMKLTPNAKPQTTDDGGETLKLIPFENELPRENIVRFEEHEDHSFE